VSEVVITGFGAVRAPSLEALPDPVRARAARTERVTQLAFSAVAPALAMAGLAATDGDPRPWIGLVLGTAFGCFLTNAAFQRRLATGGPAAASPRLFAATVSNAAAGELAIAYRLGGPAITLTAGGVAGLAALGHALDLLRAGHAEVLVAGGMDAVDAPLERWIRAGGLGSDAPAAEGAAVVVLERAAHARGRGATAHAIVHDYTLGFEPDAAARRASPRSGFAAAGVFDLLACLAELAPQASATIDARCPTGHLGAVVVQRLR
jgi:3-oxoacyl-(acyl-carrier-protein) synthase